MMKIYNNILLLSLITLFITSCSDSKEESYVFNADSAIAFNAKRLAPSENNASIQEVFNTGDTIKIYGKNGDMYPYLFADEYNALEPVDTDNAITWDKSLRNNRGYYSFYAIHNDIKPTFGNQSPDDLVASLLDTPETYGLNLSFTHSMAKIRMVLELSDGIIWDDRCKIIINGLNTAHKFVIDNSTRKLRAIPDNENSEVKCIEMSLLSNAETVVLTAIVVGEQAIEDIEIYAVANILPETEMKYLKYVPAADFLKSGHASTIKIGLKSSGIVPIETTVLPWEDDGDVLYLPKELNQLITVATEPVNGIIKYPGHLLWLTQQCALGNNKGDYIVVNDIDLRCYANWQPIGTEDFPFEGTIDGQGYELTSLYVRKTSGTSSLFGYVENATIKGISLFGEFTNSGENDNDYAASLVSNSNNSYISDCYFYGTVSGVNYAGGLIAECENSIVRECISEGYVSSAVAGGITGITSGSSYIACTNYGNVTGNSSMASVAGGIAGISDSDITACINEGTVKLNSDFNTFGDIVGDPLSNSNIFASWALKGSICGGDGEKGNIINSISAISSSILEKDIEVLNEGLKLYQDKVAGEADKECSYIWGLVNNKLTLIKQ